MDLNGIERVQLGVFSGADNIVVNNLTGTDLKQVAVNLAAAGGGGDGQADTVTVNATNANDAISSASNGASVVVNGLSEQVTIEGAEASNNSLIINGLGGNDHINASSLNAGQINLTINGGAGNDVFPAGRQRPVVRR